MTTSRRLTPLLFTLGLHSLLAGTLLLVPQRGVALPEKVYQISLSHLSPAAAPAGPPSRVETPPAPPARAVPPPPAEAAPEEKVISPKKIVESEKKPVQPKKTPVRQPTPPKAEESPAETPPATAETPAQAPSDAATGSGAGTGGGPLQVGGFAAYNADTVDQIPAIARKVVPDYPTRARRLDLQGRVIVRLVVDTSGAPQACAVHEANPPGYFEDAALEAARRTRFIPGKHRGRVVNTVVLLPFVFSLR